MSSMKGRVLSRGGWPFLMLVCGIGVLIIGTGKVTLANHVPGIAMTRRAKVAALCDSDPAALVVLWLLPGVVCALPGVVCCC